MNTPALPRSSWSLVAFAAAAVLAGCEDDTALGPTERPAISASRDVALGECDEIQVPEGSQLVYHVYAEGVRFAPLPAIMAAKKKPLVVKTLADYAPGASLATRMLKFERPAARSAGVKVKDTAELVEKLANVAKVL